MGILASRLAGSSLRFDKQAWLDGEDDGPSYRTSAGVRVDRHTALSLSTFWRCVDLIAHTVALAPRHVVVKVGNQTFTEFNPPAWLETPDPRNPSFTSDDYFAQLALSMLVDGSYFVYAAPSIYDPQGLVVLDPRKVDPDGKGKFDVYDDSGKLIATLDSSEVLHGAWLWFPGEKRGLSPLETLRRGIGGAVAADEYAGRFFGQGASLAFGVEVPGQLTDPQKADLRESLKRRHAGLSNSHAIGLLTNGAKFVPGLAPTPEQAQMLATRKFGVEDIARAFGVPPGMVGSQEPGASSYASAYVWREQFRDDAVLKFTAKIERQHDRLLTLPDRLATTPGASTHLRFNLDWVARTDLLARYQAHSEGVRGGFLTPNEARAYEDKPPVSGGDRLFMQAQMVPLDKLDEQTPPDPSTNRG